MTEHITESVDSFDWNSNITATIANWIENVSALISDSKNTSNIPKLFLRYIEHYIKCECTEEEKKLQIHSKM